MLSKGSDRQSNVISMYDKCNYWSRVISFCQNDLDCLNGSKTYFQMNLSIRNNFTPFVEDHDDLPQTLKIGVYKITDANDG